MKAIVERDGGLRWADVPDPMPGPRHALVRVRAAGVNRADLAQRAGRYPPPPGASEILGLEVAGEVVEAPEASGWRPGDRVCALLPGGGYAELAAVHARMLMPVPGRLDEVGAASLPEVHLTAFLNLMLEAGLRPGERALVHGGASGVGTAAIQQIREIGAHVATTSSAGKVARCAALGADTAAAAFALLGTGGRLIWIATLSGAKIEVDVRVAMRKRLTLKGSTLRARPLNEKITLRDAFVARLWPALEAGRIVPVVHEAVAGAEVERAHELLRANATVGKVVLRMP